MQKYDLTVLAKETAGLEDKLDTLVKALGGKSGRMVEMGKKQLAYPIAKTTQANYVSWGIELPGENVVQLEKKLTNDPAVLRHLLVKTDN